MIMKNFLFISLTVFILISCGSTKKANCDAYSINDSFEDKEISKSLDYLTEAAKNWTPEQKQEFANTFFIERGKFVVPSEPIVLKSFENN